jgi:multicomponent Na+:H+ antiporter subunit E
LLHTLSLGFALFVLWLALSGLLDPFLLALGVASCVLVAAIAWRMDVVDHEGHPIRLSWRAVFYWPWLLKEILKSNLDVARVILRPRMPIRPHVVGVRATQASELGHVIYANSITLTPGTVTIALEGGALDVHALTQDAADGLMTGEMDRRVTVMEGLVATQADAEAPADGPAEGGT